MKITLEDIFNIPTAVIYYPDRYKSVSSVSIDTRTIKKNSIYVALKGKNFDGHDFVEDAINNGAKAIVVNRRNLNRFDNVEIPIISVRNTLDALAELAKIWRNKLSAKVISITGSNGKTTTKDILAHLLRAKYKVHKTFANNNNQIGVPLTIFSAPNNTEYLVLEHGTNHFGEIEYTAKIAQPDYALITNIGHSHTKYLKSKDKILEEKSQLFNNLKMNGKVFINSDDELLREVKKKYKNVTTYGYKGRCDIKGKRIGYDPEGKLNVQVLGKNKKIEVLLPLVGEANSNNYLAALSVALEIGIAKKELIELTRTINPIKGRLELKAFSEFTIIDDTYNSNPESVKNALSLLKKYKKRKNKILVFGDMFELGDNSSELHKTLADDIDKININTVFTIGNQSKKMNAALSKIKERKHFVKRDLLKQKLMDVELTDSVILFKGSRGMKMEEFVSVLEERGN
jgi:UDP-N-acetylmuramoyl-tripeptide--D-alanyl-D-alanine ligase